MDPQQALGLVDSIVGQVAMSREQHDQARQALRVLQIAIAERKPADEPGKPAPVPPPAPQNETTTKGEPPKRKKPKA